MAVIKYKKSVYEMKIQILEGYLSQLDASLAELQRLEESIFQFWDDEKAREVADTLVKEINKVKSQRLSTQDFINLYKSIVTNYDGLDAAVGDMLDAAKEALNMLG